MTTKRTPRIKLDRSSPNARPKTQPERPSPVPNAPNPQSPQELLPKAQEVVPPESPQEPSGEPQVLPATHVAGPPLEAPSVAPVKPQVHPWWEQEYPKALWSAFEDFIPFVRLVWDHLNLPAPTAIQLDIAHYIQHGPRNAIIEAFRGVGKSWLCSAFVCWSLMRDPQLNFLVTSASKDRADQFSTFTLRLLAEFPLLQHLYPSPNQRTSKIAFDVKPAEADHSPSVKSVGIFGQMTGSRADMIISDDVEVPGNSDTQGMREKLAERTKEYSAVLKPGGRILYLGTPQTEESLYNRLPDRGYELRIWPSQVPSPSAKENYGSRLAPMIAAMEYKSDFNEHGQPTDPLRFHREELMLRALEYGKSGYALQYMLDTQLSDEDRYPLKLRDLIIRSHDAHRAPEKVIYANERRTWINDLPMIGFTGDKYLMPFEYARNEDGSIKTMPYTGSVLAIDPSGRGTDETVWCVVKMLNSQLFLMEMGASRNGYADETLQDIADCAKKHEVNMVVVEANFGDGMFLNLLTPYLTRTHPVTTEEVRHSTQKEKRIIDTLEPVMNQHRLLVDEEVVRWDYESTKALPPEKANAYRLFYQMTRMTKERGALMHDDRVDCLSIAVNYWVEQMAVDVELEMVANREVWLNEQLESFIEGVTGKTRAMVYPDSLGKQEHTPVFGGGGGGYRW